ncbi:MAG: M20/M25/M40 family metallo-hydrolase, partial [Synergistaceae bacterium]|nr:M20/M25/M40 family metallo-hydrolase [Synergistaceae bacterium]
MMDELVGMRRFLHQNAEVGDDLPITTRYVMDKLAALGLEPKEISKSGLVATIYGGKPGKTILLRADMDALPMRETNNLEFTSKTEYAHTCGHDMHTAMLLGAAKMLIEDQAEL